jgi:SAM-dependent methyltransferase
MDDVRQSTTEQDTAPAERRMSFNAAAHGYLRGRPPYPAAVFDLLASRCGLRPGVRALDIGAGPGQATGPLLAAGAHVVAIEPGASFAAILAATHAGDRLEVIVSDFETADITGTFDLAVAATSLHWLDPDIAIRKLGELVRPGGWLAAWWTEYGDTGRPTSFRDRLDDVYRDLLPAEPAYRDSRSTGLDTDRWRRVLTSGGCFHDVAVEVIEWTQILTPQAARDLWSTFPNIAELAPPARERFLTRLAAIIDTEPGGVVDDPRLTVVYTAARIDRGGGAAEAGGGGDECRWNAA